MKRAKMILLALMLMLGLLLITGCGGGEDPAGDGGGDLPTYELSLSSEYTVDNHQTIALQDAADWIYEQTDGHVKIKIFPNMALGDYTVVYGQVMTGDIDICVCPIASSYGVNADILSLPYLATDFDEFKEYFFPGSYVWDVVSEVNDNNGTVLMGIFNTGFMGIGITSPTLPAEDFATLTDGNVAKDTLLRIPGTNVFARLIPAMGYRTTTIPYSDLYAALQSGIADGWIGGSALVNWESFRDVINYFIDCRAVNECIPITMNKKLLESMPQEYQDIIKQAFLDAAERVADEREAQELQAIKDLEGYGVQIITGTDEEIEVLRDNIRSIVWAQMGDVLDQEIIDKLGEEYGVTY